MFLPASQRAKLGQTAGPAPQAPLHPVERQGPDTHMHLLHAVVPAQLCLSIRQPSRGPGLRGCHRAVPPRPPSSSPGSPAPWSRQWATPRRASPTSPTLIGKAGRSHDDPLIPGCSTGAPVRRAEGGQAACLGAGTNKGGTDHCHLSQIRWKEPALGLSHPQFRRGNASR